MKIPRNGYKVSIVALVFALTIAATVITCLPAVNAVVLPAKDSYPWITGAPNPIGVGQTVLFTFGITELLPSAAYHWTGLTISVTKPGATGPTDTLGPFQTDSTGTTYTQYVPDTVGTYYFQLNFPAQWLNNTAADTQRYYRSSTSSKFALTVQQEPIQWITDNPLPTDYWERPIYGENRLWWEVGGNWLPPISGMAVAPVNQYTAGPESSHILWTRQLEFGGIVGGIQDRGYYTGLSYERKFSCIIMQGRIYFNNPSPNTYGWYCIDQRTGETMWYKNDTIRPSFGEILRMDTPNQHGNIPYLWATFGSTYRMIDAFTGNAILDINYVPGGTRQVGKWGEILLYRLYTEGGVRKLSLWNSTLVDGQINWRYGPTSPLWRPPQGRFGPTINATHGGLNGTTGIQWTKNVTSVPGNPGIAGIDGDIIYCTAQLTNPDVQAECAYEISTGRLLWTANRTGNLAYGRFNTGPLGEGVFPEFEKEKMVWHGFDAKTGVEKWVTEPYESAWGMYHGCAAFFDGKFYTNGYSGYIHCYDAKDGKLLWRYYSGASGWETPYGHYPFFTFHDGMVIADGKVYAVTGEHSPNDPLYRGEKIHCIDAETGKGIWNISCWGIPPAIADGYALTQNCYDNQFYCYGKGKSATTITVGPKTVAKGATVLIEGTVTDLSPGQPGTPCVSKESMSAWMEYLHCQKPMPSKVTGVPVQLLAVKADGSMVDIGTVTSDTGGFRMKWTPPDEAVYTITASFAGDESYGTSYATTGLSVGPAPPAPTEPEPVEIPAYPDYTPMFAGIIIAVVIAIIIGIVNLLRKK